MKKTWMALLILATIWACHKTETDPVAELDPNEHLAGGALGTTFDQSQNAFGEQIKGLTGDEQGYFVTGNAFFRANWVTAPASVQSLDGLGPVFNAISCGGCHFKDGRAAPPETPTATLNGLLFRLSLPGMGPHGGPLPDPVYGGQLQDKSLLNVAPEVAVSVTYEEITGQYADGSTYRLRRPDYQFSSWGYGPLSAGWMFSPRIAPQVPGLGLLEAIPEAAILALADEYDADKDGVSGRPNRVWDVSLQSDALGRFGWKANQPSLLQQTAGAFNGDIGITSSVFPNEHFTQLQQQQVPGVPNGGTPEISDDLLKKVVSYMQTLAIPARRNPDDPKVLRGKYLFGDLGCATCHHPNFLTGTSTAVSALQQQQIWPYSDLLLHDMGEGLADGRPDFLATGNEWRTPPLWGVGLIETVNQHHFLLHDGRARSVEEAILWHGGEGAQAQEKFRALRAADREALLQFVQSL